MTNTIGNANGGASIHILLQGKGGVGKSLISAILSQYLLSKGQDVRGIDADPVNQTLSEYRGLAVSCLNLLKEGSVDQREFDLLMERFLTESGTFVVDTGASTFIPLWHYILENHALDYLRERGKRVFVHSVITGGQSLNDTLAGFEQLAETTREKNIVVWLNEYFGNHGEAAVAGCAARPFRTVGRNSICLVRAFLSKWGKSNESSSRARLKTDNRRSGSAAWDAAQAG